MRIQATDHKTQRKLEAKERRRSFGMLFSVFLGSIGVVAIAAVILGTIALVEYYKVPEAVFEIPPKTVKIPPKPPEHKMNVAKHEASKPKPTFTQKLLSTIPTEFALPDLPQVPLDQMLPLDPSELISDQVSSLMGTSGIGNGMGNGLLGGGGTGGGTGFMGINADGDRILLIFDISSSVINKAEKIGVPFSKIREETKKLIKTLPINARFNIIQFSRSYKPFQKELIVASGKNKAIATNWIDSQWSDSGSLSSRSKGVDFANGIEDILNVGFDMKPDVIFLISDASFQMNKDGNSNYTVDHRDLGKHIDNLQKKSTSFGGCKLNFIGFGVKPEDAASMKKLIRRQKGKYLQIE